MQVSKAKEYHARLVDETIDIRSYPKPLNDLPLDEPIDLYVGDLHSNPMKLIHFLVKHNALKISPDDYQQLVEQYKVLGCIHSKTSKGEINKAKVRFCEILERTAVSSGAQIIISGDELQDRGCDYFMLKVYQKLKQNNVPLQTLLSNHGNEFIRSYEAWCRGETKGLQPLLMQASHARSTSVTQKMLDLQCIYPAEVHALVRECYLPTLKVFSYSFDERENSLVFNAHAPADLFTLRMLAEKWDVEPKLDLLNQNLCARDIANTIDAINAHFQKYVAENKISELTDPQILKIGYFGKENIDPAKNPLEFALWNRQYSQLVRSPKVGKASLTYVHGHDEDDPQAHEAHIVNLDSTFGKVFQDPHFEGRFLSFSFVPNVSPESILRHSSDVLNSSNDRPLKRSIVNSATFFDKENSGSSHEDDLDQFSSTTNASNIL